MVMVALISMNHYMDRSNRNSSASEVSFDMREEIIFEIRSSRSPIAHIQPSNSFAGLALNTVHLPSDATVTLALSLHELLNLLNNLRTEYRHVLLGNISSPFDALS